MSGVKPLNRFDFHDQAVIHQKIDSESRWETQSVELNVDRLLPFNSISSLQELARKYGLVDRLHQPGAKLPVQTKGEIKDASSQMINVHNAPNA
jgi:hypothetical protein